LRSSEASGSPDVLRVEDGKVVRSYLDKPLSDCIYMAGFDPETNAIKRSRTVYDDCGEPVECDWGDFTGSLLVKSDSKVFVAPDLVRGCTRALQSSSGHKAIISLHEGVPGAGKTYDIVRKYNAQDTIIVGCTRFTVDDIIKELLAFGHPKERIKRTVKTCDSYLMHSRERARVLLVDEALMAHAGQIMAIVRLTGAREVHLYGDRQQIGFIDRNNVRCLSFSSLTAFDKCTTNPLSRRIPASAAAGLHRYYVNAGGIVSNSTCPNPPEVMRVRSIGELGYDTNYQYLVLYQDEKKLLQTRGFTNVMTVHESQGKTFENVYLVRSCSIDKPLCNTDAYCVVGCSRHKRQFVYVTVTDKADLFTRFVADANDAAMVALCRSGQSKRRSYSD